MNRKELLKTLVITLVVTFFTALVSEWFAWHVGSLNFAGNILVTTGISSAVFTLVAAFYNASSDDDSNDYPEK